MVPHKPIIDVRSTIIEGQKPVRPNTTAAQTTQGQTTQAQPIATATTGNQGANQSTSSTRSKTQLSTTVPDEFKGSTNQELIDYLQRKVNGYNPLSDEDLEKIRKRQKAEGMISGVSDVVRAISNMAFTNKYAPNMYDPSTSMSAKAKARFEKEKADRDAEDDRYFNYAMMLGKLRGDDQDRGLKIWQTEQNLAREDQRWEAEELREQAKADYDAAMADLELKLMLGKIDKQKADTEAAKIRAKYAAKYELSRINKNNRTPAARGGGRRGGGGATKKYPIFDKNGDVVDHVYTIDEAVSETERRGGTYPEVVKTQSQDRTAGEGLGKKTSKTSTTTTTKHSAGRQARAGVASKGKGYGTNHNKGKGY